MVTLFGLAPASPLDGGHLLRAAVWRLTGREATGTRAAEAAGRVLAGVLLVVAVVASASGDAAVALWLAVLALGVRGA